MSKLTYLIAVSTILVRDLLVIFLLSKYKVGSLLVLFCEFLHENFSVVCNF